MLPRVIGGPCGCLAMIVVENKQTDRRRQIGVLAPLVDHRDKACDWDALGGGDLLKRLPERIFQTDAALTSGNLDRPFDNQRGALRLLRHLRHSRATKMSG